MTPEIFIKRQCNATMVEKIETIQSLWSGYGEIARYMLSNDVPDSTCSFVIVKNCLPPKEAKHPRGWQSPHAHQRKIESYNVEQNWYRNWAGKLPKRSRDQHASFARVAHSYGDFFDQKTGQRLILLEDLDAAGFTNRYDANNETHLRACIHWLASFHARFIYDSPPINWPQGLWKQGTYWHLNTRQDEYNSMDAGKLKNMAVALSEKLDQARFKTLVHGDAKVANFCFSSGATGSFENDRFEGGNQVAAVDFQYVGGGVGVKDLAYLLGSALPEQALENNLPYWLDVYFSELGRSLLAQGESSALVHEVTEEWQDLFAIAWADFHRFIVGWSPTHVKNTPFSQQLTEHALTIIEGEI